MPKRVDALDPVVLLCRAHKLPLPECEVRVVPNRRFRYDYYWRPQRVALEKNGGVFSQGRHVRGTGFLRDMEKLNLGQLAGDVILQATPQQIRSGAILPLLREALR